MPGGKVGPHPKGGWEKCRDLFRDAQQARAEEELEPSVTSRPGLIPGCTLLPKQ